MNPAKLQRLLKEGLALHQSGRLAEAEVLYKQARAAAPKSFDALHLSGALALQQGRPADAVDLLSRAQKIDPRSASCEMRLGLALALLDRHTEADLHYRASIKWDDKIPETWNNLAISLKALGKVEESLQAYRRAIELRPDYYDAYDRLGALLADTKGFAAGIPYFRKAVELKPDYATAWCNLGVALQAEHKHAEALECFDRTLKLDPHFIQALVGQGLVFQQCYRLKEAIATYDRVIAAKPTHFDARSAKLLCLNYLEGLDRSTVFQAHLEFGLAAESRVAAPVAPHPVSQGRKKIAFLSPDLRSHSVAYFLAPILENLPKSEFDVILYHDHFVVDAMSERLKQSASLWRNFVGQPHIVVERTIRADAPDVLIDLAGHTGFNRLPLFARRLAPVQLSYLGYPNTTGLKAMDFRFVDSVTDPSEEDQAFHTEKLIRFSSCAWSYQPPSACPEPNATSTRTITFGSFNNFAKVSEQTLGLWCDVLAAVPESRLLLKGHSLDDPSIGSVIRSRMNARGIAPERVELLGRTPNLQMHLACYQRIDVALDTFPYHGTTTTCEALWMGVPVVTLNGDRHAARVSSSLLTAIGQPEWIAQTAAEYVALATRLAANRDLREKLRFSLRDQMRQSPLLDYAGQARKFANALHACIREKTVG